MPLAKLPLEGFTPGGDDLLAILPFAMVLGFIIGTVGHLIGSRRVVIAGVVVIFITTLLLPLALYRGP